MAATTIQKPKFSVALQTDGYQRLINNTLQDPKRAQRFIASISSAVAVNPALQECDAGSILAGALLGESLNLSPSPQLGHYYLVPFNVGLKDANGKQIYRKDEKGNNLKDEKGYWIKEMGKKAQFMLGYKGYIQLALRSGQYKRLNVKEVKKGELIRYDPFDEEIELRPIEDSVNREVAPTIGYYAMFEYIGGCKKILYWSKEKMEQHAQHYSKAYNTDDSFWKKDFDTMARKTMLRQLIGKWGIMSIEMQQGYENDYNDDSASPEYIVGADISSINAELQSQISGQMPTETEETEPPKEKNAEPPQNELPDTVADNEPEQVSIDDL